MDTNWIELASDAGAVVFVIWLAHRMTTHTIPRLANQFDEQTEKQRQDFKEALRQQRDDFRDALQRQREDDAERREREYAAQDAQAKMIAAAIDRLGREAKEGHRDNVPNH